MANPFRSIRIFYGETKTELKKASWPTRVDLKNNTIVVLIAIILLGAYISIADFCVYNWVQLLTHFVR